MRQGPVRLLPVARRPLPHKQAEADGGEQHAAGDHIRPDGRFFDRFGDRNGRRGAFFGRAVGRFLRLRSRRKTLRLGGVSGHGKRFFGVRNILQRGSRPAAFKRGHGGLQRRKVLRVSGKRLRHPVCRRTRQNPTDAGPRRTGGVIRGRHGFFRKRALLEQRVVAV